MDWLTLILTMMVGIIGIRYFFFGRLKKFERMKILHKRPWPILGNFGPAIFKRCPRAITMDQIYRMHQDASYVGIYNMTDPVIMLRSPELIRSITIKNFDHFVNHYPFLDPELDPLLGKTMFGLCGEEWKKLRNLLTPAFTSSKMKSMFQLMSDCAKNFTDHLAAQSAEKPSVLDGKESFTRYTNDVIATCAFGINVDSMKNPKNDFYVMGRRATNLKGLRGIKLLFLNSFPRISKLFNMRFIAPSIDKFFSSIVKDTIDTRDREGIRRPDILQLMMDSRGKESGEAPLLTIREITAHAFGLFFAGIHNVSSTMCFAAYEIAIKEEVQRKLQEEVDEVMIRTNGERTYEALNEMQYLDAVVSETLRLYPIATVHDRICVKEFELPPALPGGRSVTIEAGQTVWLPAFCLHRDSKYFPDPTKFDPGRFMGTRKNDINPFTYFPFGQGPRFCIGNRFALLEIKVMFFYLLSKCQLTPSPKTRVPLILSKSDISLSPEGGFWIQLQPRSSATGKMVEH